MGRKPNRTPGAHLLRRLSRVFADKPVIGGSGVVAVSGGPDSVALACLLTRLHEQKRLGPLVLAHLNHQLRGPESDADESFVAELAKKLAERARIDLRFRAQRQDVAALARDQKQNLEHLSRRLRYDWLVRVAKETGGGWIATGHTADDQAETVLHHLVRGTGLAGLRGIAPRRKLCDGVWLLRPLLRTTRTEVMHYLREIEQPFRQDSSNLDMRFTRNRIRHELLPDLEGKFNPAVKRVLARLAEQAGELHRDIDVTTRRLLRKAELPRAGGLVILSGDALKKASRYQVQELLRLIWKRECWPGRPMTYDDWRRLAGLVDGSEQAIDLPGRIHGRSTGRVIQIGPH